MLTIQPMTQAEYAKHRGVARQTIHKMVKAGKIPVGNDGKIDAAAADFALGENRARIDEPQASAPQTAESIGLTRARTANEVYKARIAQLEYQKRLGNVLPKAGVIDASSRCGEVMLRIIRGLSMRAEEIAAAGTREGIAGVRTVLKAIERDQLTRAAAAFSDLAEQATLAHEAELATVEDDDAQAA
jgi:hypothetical protein